MQRPSVHPHSRRDVERSACDEGLFGADTVYLVCYLALVFYLFYPGMPGLDATHELRDAARGYFRGQSPPLYLHIALSLLWINPSEAATGIFIFCLILFCLALGSISRSLIANRRARLIALVVTTLSPPILANIAYVGTDPLLCVFLLASLSFLANLRDGARWWRHCAFLGYCLLACMARYNAAFVLLPLLFYWLIVCSSAYDRRISKLKIGIGAVVLVFAINWAATVASSALISERRDRGGLIISLSYILMHDLVGTSLCANEKLLPSQFDDWSITDLNEIYTPDSGTLFWRAHSPSLMLNPDMMSTSGRTGAASNQYKFIRGRKLTPLTASGNLVDWQNSWKRAVWNYPVCYFKHRWHQWLALMGLGSSGVCLPYQDNISYAMAVGRAPQFEPGTLRFWLNRKVTKVFFVLRDSAFFSGWLYFLILAAFSLTPTRLLGPNGKVLKVIVFSALLYMAAYFFIAPSCSFRYLWWPVVASHILIGVVLARILHK